MSNDPVDSFSDINLEDLKRKNTPNVNQNKKVNAKKEKIKEAANQSKFVSREVKPIKPKTKTKSFSLFPEDIGIINDALKQYIIHSQNDDYAVSGSDVVRAGLQLLSQHKPEQITKLLNKSRGRTTNG